MVTAEKAKLKSRAVYEGYHRAFARSYLRAMGLTDDDIAKPFVGVVSAWNETSPCNVHLNRFAALAKEGVKEAGGTPREFTTIAVTDGIAMGYEGMKASLVSREVIADSIELTMLGHGYDALVGIAGCDKTLPGIMMAMARLNVPSVFMYGGSILPGRFEGRDVTIQDVFESVGAVEAGLMTEQQQRELECVACPERAPAAACLRRTRWRAPARRLASRCRTARPSRLSRRSAPMHHARPAAPC